MSPIVQAAVLLSAIFLSALVGVLVPLAVNVTPRLTKVGNAFAAGVLSSAAIVHLQPAAHDAMLEALGPSPGDDSDERFPYDGLATLMGAIVVFLLDFSMRGGTNNKDDDNETTNNNNYNKNNNINMTNNNNSNNNSNSNSRGRNYATFNNDAFRKRLRPWNHHLYPTVPTTDDSHKDHHEPDEHQSPRTYEIYIDQPSSTTTVSPTQQQTSHSPKHTHTKPSSSRLGIALLLAVSLSFHSLMEGVALGTSLHELRQFSIIAIAILAHKLFAALSLGSSLASSQQSKSLSVFIGLGFALSTPIGAVVGAGLVSLVSAKSSLITAWLTCVSAGVFLYVAFVDMLADEIRESSNQNDEYYHDRRLRAFLFILSASAMSLLAVWV